jgi:hypothetical protein
VPYRLALLVAASTLCTSCIAADVAVDEQALAGDPVQACPVPEPGAIAGHESDFYRCAEETLACGPEGYLIGYGARYAERFYRETRPRMSSRGRAWIDDVLVCLQDELRSSIDASSDCDDVRTIAFDSHPGCYLDAGFCQLSLADVFHVVGTVDLADWLSADAARQVVRTAASCSKTHAWWMWLLFGDLMR